MAAMTGEPPAILDVSGLCVDFHASGDEDRRVEVLHDVSLCVHAGEILAVVGQSGSGKSVTSLAITRLVESGGGRITAGSMMLARAGGDPVDLRRLSEKAMRSIRGAVISMIFQEPMTSLNPVLTVAQQLVEPVLLHQHCSRQSALATARRLLDQVRIPSAADIMKRYPHELSGGMRQRVMIAVALSCKPMLLVADEPTTALDVTVQAQILALMRELQREIGMGVLFITHDMGVVAEIADRVAVMQSGRVVEQSGVNEIFAHPGHPYTRALLGAVPLLGSMRGTSLPKYFELPGVTAETGAPGAVAQPGPGGDVGDGRGDTVLSVDGLVTRFDIRGGFFSRVRQRVHAVEHVSFNLRAGETLSLVGESGSGKTTVARSLMHLAVPRGGVVAFDGQRIDPRSRESLAILQRNIQFVFQDPFASLNPRMRVGDSIKEPLIIHGLMSGDAARRRVGELLERVGLSAAMAGRWPHEFSGGQRQRICIARALSIEPRIIIADEATAALDVFTQAQIINLLIELQRELGVAYLFISHNMAVVERISHRVAVMYLGQIVEMGPRRAVFEEPQHPYTRKLLDSVPVADPARRRPPRALETSDIPSPIHPVDYAPVLCVPVDLGHGHFVAPHAAGTG